MFSINLNFVDSRIMRRLNQEYRHLNQPTTVLSFYYGESDKDGCLGEIFICPGQAKEQKLTIEKLVVHGFKTILSQIPAAKFKST